MIEGYFHRATQKEIEFFEKSLYPLQDQIFQLIQNDRFYLSGGTCLSRFYFQHRYSEDLDFFYDGINSPKEEFERAIIDLFNRVGERFKLEITVSGEHFRRAFIHKDETILKVELIYENYRGIGERKKTGDIYIDSKENIATNKLTAIYDRKTVKDFFDLYFLLRGLDIKQIAKWAEYKMVPLDYEGTLLALSNQPLEGTVVTNADVALSDFNDFVAELVKKIISYAKESR